MNITDIKKLNPCRNRLDNYRKHYGNRTFTLNQFMGLKHLTHEDKVWVAVRQLSGSNARLAAADIAESVLYIFEKDYPNDSRPRKAIEAARAYVAGKITKEEMYAAAAASSRASYAASYYAASYYAAPASYAASADYASYSAFGSKEAQEKLNRKILLNYWKKGV